MLDLEKVFEEAEKFLKDNKPINTGGYQKPYCSISFDNSMDFDFLYQNFEAALIDTD